MPGPATQEPRGRRRRGPLLACRSQHERDKPGAGAPAQRRARRRRARAASGDRGGKGAVRTQNTPPASRRPAERDARGGPRRGGGRGGSCTCCSMGSRAARCARWEAALARREGAGGRFGRGSKGVLGGGRVVRGPAPRSAHLEVRAADAVRHSRLRRLEPRLLDQLVVVRAPLALELPLRGLTLLGLQLRVRWAELGEDAQVAARVVVRAVLALPRVHGGRPHDDRVTGGCCRHLVRMWSRVRPPAARGPEGANCRELSSEATGNPCLEAVLGGCLPSAPALGR